MTEPVISVIVPIYNVQSFLSGCLESLMAQTFHDIEIICVDDGATDESGSIAESYADKDSRITVIHQENKGLSGARNTGIDKARGKYIAFCDSDDYLHPDFLKRLYDTIENTEADVACCKLISTKEKYKGDFPDLEKIKVNVEITNDPIMTFLTTKNIPTGVCVKLYRQSVIKDMRFIEGIYFEDVPFTTGLMMRVKKVAITNLPMYYYYTNPSSIMRTSFTEQKVESYVHLIRYIARDTENLRPDLIPVVRKKVLNGRFKMMVNQAIRKQKNISVRKHLFDKIQRVVIPLFQEGIISYAGLKLRHRITLFLLLHCKTSAPARWVMTLL